MNPVDFIETLPNYGGAMHIQGALAPYSNLELSKPTGKYIARGIIRLFNALMEKHYVRYVGHSCAPGLYMAPFNPKSGYAQFEHEVKKCGVIIGNVYSAETFKDAISLPADPYMVIYLRKEWKHFEDYLNAFSSKYRTRTRRVFALSEELLMKRLSGEALEETLPACAHLLLETLKHKTITLGKDLELLLRRFHQYWQDKFVIHAYYKDQTLIGFISYIEFQDQIYAMHLGYLIEPGTHMHIYQRMMYDVIRQGIEQEATQINLGRTAPEIKSTLGAVPLENSLIFYTRNRFMKFLLNTYKKRYYKAPQYIIRHPFKDAKAA